LGQAASCQQAFVRSAVPLITARHNMVCECPAQSACCPALLGLLLPVFLAHGSGDTGRRKLGPVFNGDHGFDCHIGVSHWKQWWSPKKKEWCCQNHRVACAEKGAQSRAPGGSINISSSSTSSRVTAATTIEVTTMATTTHQNTEVTTKATTTTQTTEETTRASPTVETTKVTTRAATTSETPKVTTQASTMPKDVATEEWWFDCEADFSEWQDSWPTDKTGWCCLWWHHQQKWPGDSQQEVCCNGQHLNCERASPTVAPGLPMLPVVMPGEKFEKEVVGACGRISTCSISSCHRCCCL